MQKADEAWVVVDRDSWPAEHLAELHAWSQSKENFGFALSNPMFEYWLLLHFEDGDRVANGEHCNERLRRHLPNYDKHIHEQHFTPARIQSAVDRARRRDDPPCADWPRNPGSTTVYRLVERILAVQGSNDDRGV